MERLTLRTALIISATVAVVSFLFIHGDYTTRSGFDLARAVMRGELMFTDRCPVEDASDVSGSGVNQSPQYEITTPHGDKYLVNVPDGFDRGSDSILAAEHKKMSAEQLSPPAGCGISLPYSWILSALIVFLALVVLKARKHTGSNE